MISHMTPPKIKPKKVGYPYKMLVLLSCWGPYYEILNHPTMPSFSQNKLLC